MYKLKKYPELIISDTSVYMEIYNENQTAYRVISVSLGKNSADMVYGVEIENFRTGEKEGIYDFSDSVEKAVNFTELLIKNKNTPAQLYNIALKYLGTSIYWV